MALKNTWVNGEKVRPADLNAIATAINVATQALADIGAIAEVGDTGRDVLESDTPEQARAAIEAAADEEVVHLLALDDDPTLAGNSSNKIATQRATKAFVLAKIAALIGAAPPELDTWIELVAQIQADQSAISALTTLIGTKADESDIATATAALVGGATSAGNTLKKLEDLIAGLSASLGGAPPVKFNTTTTAWPSRPAVSFPIFWIGGDAPDDRPPGYQPSDVWFPASGDDIDLGVVLEALQGISAVANTIPYFDAINHAANLGFKIAMSTPALDTNVLSEKATKDYIDAQIAAAVAAQSATANNDLGTSTALTMAAAHAGKVNSMRPATAATLTVPLNSVTPLPLGIPFEYLADGAGQITVTKGNAAITFKSAGNATKSRLQNSSFILWQQSTDVWLITGDITT
ncbi:hypothetical protein H7J86_24640 [Mycobacterium hackensackense]|uniref:hypothetical protein n=1 Tax=Mycobacterium hackensackense TaxID=228909 RepID=UPI002265BEEC|nr:hypothetical protein [Mycobacterium hackensackense]MCV7255356.1 hypothetical protein [Mycobacterium hackensackense]